MDKSVRKLIRNVKPSILIRLGSQPNGFYANQSVLTREMKIPITTLNYHITKMKGEGLISKQNSPLILTEKGIKAFKFLWDNIDKTKIRAHNVQVVFKVTKCNKPYRNYSTIYEPFSNQRYKGIKTVLKGCSVLFYHPKKVVATLPDMFADTDEELASEVCLLVPDMKGVIEKELDITIGEHKIAKIQRMHVAVLNSNISKAYSLKGYTEENDEFAIDESHGIPEVELTNKDNALGQIMDLIKLDEEYGQSEAYKKLNIQEEDRMKLEELLDLTKSEI